jgi:hypothetical protein
MAGLDHGIRIGSGSASAGGEPHEKANQGGEPAKAQGNPHLSGGPRSSPGPPTCMAARLQSPPRH